MAIQDHSAALPRRHVVAGIIGSTLVSAYAAAHGRKADDPTVLLCAEWHRLYSTCVLSDEDEAGNEVWFSTITAVEAKITEAGPVSIAGAAALMGVLLRRLDGCEISSMETAIAENVAQFLNRAA